MKIGFITYKQMKEASIEVLSTPGCNPLETLFETLFQITPLTKKEIRVSMYELISKQFKDRGINLYDAGHKKIQSFTWALVLRFSTLDIK